jgi:uncharacterized protein (DUF433 family)
MDCRADLIAQIPPSFPSGAEGQLDLAGSRAKETTVEIFPGISVDAGIRFGKPCLAGTRIDVATVLGALGAGENFETVQKEYALTREQILDALRYGAHVAAHQPPAVKAA